MTRDWQFRDMGCVYDVVIDGASLQVVPLPGAGTLTVGRSQKCDVSIDSGSVSRHHANLLIAQGKVEIEDVGSSNGTTIEGARLAANHPVPLTVGVPFLVVTIHLLHRIKKPQ